MFRETGGTASFVSLPGTGRLAGCIAGGLGEGKGLGSPIQR